MNPRRTDALSALLIVAIPVAAAAALRFPALDASALWADEVLSADRLQIPLSRLLTVEAVVVQTPLYYLLLRAWCAVAGTSDAALRGLSAVLGVAAVGLVAGAAWRLAGRRAGLAAGLLAAVHPGFVYFSREARSYPLMLALEAASWLVLARAAGGRGRTAGAHAGMGALHVATVAAHYTAAPVAAAQGLVLVVVALRRRRWGDLAAYLGPLALVAALAGVSMLRQAASLESQWGPRAYPGAAVAAEVAGSLLGDGWFGLGAAGMVALAVAGAALLAGRGPLAEGGLGGGGAAVLLAAGIVLPLAVAVGLPLVLDVPLKLRYGAAALPPLAILAGAAARGVNPDRGAAARAAPWAVLAATILAMGPGLRPLYSPALHHDWRNVADYLGDVVLPDRTLLLVSLKTTSLARRYAAGRYSWDGMDELAFGRPDLPPPDLEEVARAMRELDMLVVLHDGTGWAAGYDMDALQRAAGPYHYHHARVRLSDRLVIVIYARRPIHVPDPAAYGPMEEPPPTIWVR